MAIFGTMGVGIAPFQGILIPPDKKIYKNVKFYGDMIIDDIHIIDNIMSLSEIESLDILESPVWDSETLLLCLFDDNLNGGNITNVTNPITGLEIYRKEILENSFNLLGTLNPSSENFIDIKAQPYKTYEYQMVASNDNERSEPILGSQLYIDLHGDFIIDSNTQAVYVMDLNLSESATENKSTFNIYEGLSKYPSVLKSIQDYNVLSLSAIPINNYNEVINDIEQNVNYLDRLKDFINNDNDKILKTRKGFIYLGSTYNYKHEPLNINMIKQPYYVNFEFVETGDVI